MYSVKLTYEDVDNIYFALICLMDDYSSQMLKNNVDDVLRVSFSDKLDYLGSLADKFKGLLEDR